MLPAIRAMAKADYSQEQATVTAGGQGHTHQLLPSFVVAKDPRYQEQGVISSWIEE